MVIVLMDLTPITLALIQTIYNPIVLGPHDIKPYRPIYPKKPKPKIETSTSQNINLKNTFRKDPNLNPKNQTLNNK
jgi:hypothetical protein